MASRHQRLAPVYEYQPYHFNAAVTDQAVGSNTHGTFLGGVVIGTPGTGVTITLYNGNPGNAGKAISVITPSAVDSVAFNCTCDQGLYITIAGTTIGDYTVMALDHPI